MILSTNLSIIALLPIEAESVQNKSKLKRKVRNASTQNFKILKRTLGRSLSDSEHWPRQICGQSLTGGKQTDTNVQNRPLMFKTKQNKEALARE